MADESGGPSRSSTASGSSNGRQSPQKVPQEGMRSSCDHSVRTESLNSPSNSSPVPKKRKVDTPKEISAVAIRKKLPKPRRIPTQKHRTGTPVVMPDDEPPSVIPESYINPHRLVKPGDEITVWWEGDDRYYPGVVRSLRSDGRHRVEYDDGQVLYHFLNREVFILIGKTREQFLARCFPADAEKHEGNPDPVYYPGLVEFLEVGHSVEIYWPSMKQWYPAVISGKGSDELSSILYDDGDRQLLNMKHETFRWIGESAAIAHSCLMHKYSEELSVMKNL